MKEAYTQVLESEEDDDSVGDQIKPRDVGHNIYILAHQVCGGGRMGIQIHNCGPEKKNRARMNALLYRVCCCTSAFLCVCLLESLFLLPGPDLLSQLFHFCFFSVCSCCFLQHINHLFRCWGFFFFI